MAKNIISGLMVAFIALYFGCAYQITSPTLLDLLPGNLLSLSNLLLLLFIGLSTGLGFWSAANARLIAKSKTLVLGACIPLLLLLPALFDFKLGILALPNAVLIALLGLAFYYSVLVLNLKKTASMISAFIVVAAMCFDLWQVLNHSSLNTVANSHTAYRFITCGAVLIFALNNYLKKSYAFTLGALLFGELIALGLKHLAVLDATTAWAATMLLMAIGTWAQKSSGYLVRTLTLLVLAATSFMTVTGIHSSAIINHELLAFAFSHFVENSLLGHGYGTLAQAAVVNKLGSPNELNLLALTIYETGLGGILALALAFWLSLRNSLKLGLNVTACLNRTALLVPLFIGTLCAPNIASDYVVLFATIALIAMLERTSFPNHDNLKPQKSNFLQYQLIWIIALSVSLYCITGIFSLRSLENDINNYHLKSIKTAYTLFNRTLKPLPPELSAFFNVPHLDNPQKKSNFQRIFYRQEQKSLDYLNSNSKYHAFTNDLLNLWPLKKGDLFFNPFPEFSRLQEAELKYSALISVDTTMSLLGLEAFDNMQAKVKTSIDPDFMFASFSLCQYLEQGQNQNQYAKLLGYQPDFKTCMTSAKVLQNKLAQAQPLGFATFSSYRVTKR